MAERNEQPKLSIDELAERTGIPTRTIRYYITTRLITGPTSRGKQASYSIDHVLRLHLIRKLTARHVPLDENAVLGSANARPHRRYDDSQGSSIYQRLASGRFRFLRTRGR